MERLFDGSVWGFVSAFCDPSTLRSRATITVAFWLVFLPAGFVARSLQIHADMRLARVSPAGKHPAP